MKLPSITPRQTIEDKFSQFLFFEEIKVPKNPQKYSDIFRWRTERRLQQNLRSPQLKEYDNEFALCRFFLKILKDDSLSSERKKIAAEHIVAYLQEICYWSAKTIYKNIKNLPNNYDNEYDCWGEIISYINEPDEELLEKSQEQEKSATFFKGLKFFKNYNLTRLVSLESFTSYAKKTITNRVEDKIRTKLKNDKCTEWALLKNITKAKFIKSLKKAAINEIKQLQYSLVLQCYKEIYKSNDKKGGHSLKEPTDEQYKQMFSLYNQRLSELEKDNLYLKLEPLKTWQEFQEMLRFCIDIARAYDNPPPTQSLSDLEPPIDDNNDDTISNLGCGEREDFSEDEANEREQVNQCLSNAFDTLSLEQKTLLSCLRGFTFKQEDAKVILGIPQYKISRIKTKCYKILSEALAQCLKVPLSHEILERLELPLEEWLINHYQQQIYSVLNQACTLLNQEQLHICRDYARIIREDSKENLTREQENMIVQFNSLKQALIQPLRDYFTNDLKISISGDNKDIIETRFNLVLEEWLKDTNIENLSTTGDDNL